MQYGATTDDKKKKKKRPEYSFSFHISFRGFTMFLEEIKQEEVSKHLTHIKQDSRLITLIS